MDAAMYIDTLQLSLKITDMCMKDLILQGYFLV